MGVFSENMVRHLVQWNREGGGVEKSGSAEKGIYRGQRAGVIPARNGLSDLIAKDLKKRGLKYLGSVTVYAHLQACGMVNDHAETCFRYRRVTDGAETVRKRRDSES